MPALTLEDLNGMADIFNVVTEPGYSQGKLREYQRKYLIDTDKFINDYFHCPEALTYIDEKDKEKWFFNWRIFKEADGRMSDLKNVFFDDMSTDFGFSWDYTIDKGQAVVKGEQKCSPSL